MLRWACDPLLHEEQIRSGLWIAREAASSGYDVEREDTREPRKRSQGVIQAVVAHIATKLEAYFGRNAASRETDQDKAQTYAKCLEYACATYYFGAGAFPERNSPHTCPIQTDAGKRRFLADTESTLRRIADVAFPQTMHKLTLLLDFLLDGNPELGFDLFAYGLTTSGHKMGFQSESLGADVFVRIVSRCLADYEYIFRNEDRRKTPYRMY